MPRLSFQNLARHCSLLGCAAFAAVAFATDPAEKLVLFDFEDGFAIESVEARGVVLTLETTGTDHSLQLVSWHDTDWPGITLKPADGAWDGSQYQNLSFDVTNLNDDAFELGLRIDNPGGDSRKNFTVMTRVAAGASRKISAAIYNTPYRFSTPLVLEGMHAAPGQSSIDPTQITEVRIFLRNPKSEHRFTIDNVRFETPMTEMDPEEFLPFIDEFGQFIHDDWPGKTHSEDDLIAFREAEKKELAEQPGPESFGRFGGWKDGPEQEKSEFFRTEKIDGRWWLIDPDGQLFWSHGSDSVSTRFGGTGTEHREKYFRDLPEDGEEFAKFYSRSDWAFGFYQSRTPYMTYNFLAANLYRKYGQDWRTEFADVAHKRMRSWGMNTLGSWSDPAICEQRRTPYVAFVHITKGKILKGAQKMWTQFHDVFAPEFVSAIAHGIEGCKYGIGDPWCIGFYIDNELYWGNEIELAQWTLGSPAEQPAKQEFIRDLQAKYESIEKLNAAWGAEHADWSALAAATASPDVSKADADLRAFTKKTSETYFRTVKEVQAEAAPGQLYLGCRFIWDNPTAVRAACDHCDVVSFNRYVYSIRDLSLPSGEDKPVMIGEFHFGAMDRGMFHPSKVPARDQEHRAECYTEYVQSALENPLLVGTHWFQYTSEPTAGRGDGENYQIGFVDNCDTPYDEIIAASRKIGAVMYEYRSEAEVTAKE